MILRGLDELPVVNLACKFSGGCGKGPGGYLRSVGTVFGEKMLRTCRFPFLGLALWEFRLEASILSAFSLVSRDSRGKDVQGPNSSLRVRIMGVWAQGFDFESVFAFQKCFSVGLSENIPRVKSPSPLDSHYRRFGSRL